MHTAPKGPPRGEAGQEIPCLMEPVRTHYRIPSWSQPGSPGSTTLVGTGVIPGGFLRQAEAAATEGRALRLLAEFEASWLTAWRNTCGPGTTAGRIAARWGDDRRNLQDRYERDDPEQGEEYG